MGAVEIEKLVHFRQQYMNDSRKQPQCVQKASHNDTSIKTYSASLLLIILNVNGGQSDVRLYRFILSLL